MLTAKVPDARHDLAALTWEGQAKGLLEDTLE